MSDYASVLRKCKITENKFADFVYYVESCPADIITTTENWLTADDTAHRVEITSPGYKLQDQPRSGRVG